jgi:hypothetical protein
VPQRNNISPYFVCVVGAGTAVMAGRTGISAALLDNKPGTGGNACSEVGGSIEGAHFFGFIAKHNTQA